MKQRHQNINHTHRKGLNRKETCEADKIGKTDTFLGRLTCT